MEIKEYEVLDEFLNPFPRTKKAKIIIDLGTMRESAKRKQIARKRNDYSGIFKSPLYFDIFFLLIQKIKRNKIMHKCA